MREARDDSQQRGWAVRDDSEIISQYLEELIQILVRLSRIRYILEPMV